MHAGQVVLALLILLPLLGLLLRAGRQAQRARGSQGQPRARGGIVSGWFAHRRTLREKQADHENGMLRDAARHRQRLAEQEARRNRESGSRDPGATEDGSTRPRRGTVRGTVIRIWDDMRPPRPDDPAPGSDPAGEDGDTSPGEDSRRRRLPRWHLPRWRRGRDGDRGGRRDADGDGTSAPPEPPPARGEPAPTRSRPGRPARPEAPPPSPTLEGTIVTTPAAPETVPGVEMVVEGLRAIYAHAMSGNIQAKRRGIHALIEVARRAGMTALTMSRAMGEPGRHYGTAVTERIARMAAGFSLAQTAGAEADAELYAILTTPPAETMAAGRPMPHHNEFAETGSH